MDVLNLLFWVWFALMNFLLVGVLFGLMSKKEALGICLIVLVIADIFSVHLVFESHYWWGKSFGVFLSIWNGRRTWQTYKEWKDTDDDDDDINKRKRRRLISKAKNKIPKPKVIVLRPMPMPT